MGRISAVHKYRNLGLDDTSFSRSYTAVSRTPERLTSFIAVEKRRPGDSAFTDDIATDGCSLHQVNSVLVRGRLPYYEQPAAGLRSPRGFHIPGGFFAALLDEVHPESRRRVGLPRPRRW